METQLGARTLHLWTLLLRAARGPSPAPSVIVRRTSAGRTPAFAAGIAEDGWTGDAPSDPCMDACRAHRELRLRLVAEYRRRLDLVRAALTPLHDAWATAAMERARRLAAALDAWDAYLAAADARDGEPAADLHALGAEVLDLVSRAATHLAWSGPPAPAAAPAFPFPLPRPAVA